MVVALLLIPQVAHAVPGPELLLPVAAGTLQLAVLLLAAGRGAVRRHTSPQAVVVGGGLLLAWVVMGFTGAVLVGLALAAPRSRLAAVVLAVIVCGALAIPPARPPALPVFTPAAEAAPAFPRAGLAEVRAGGRPIVFLGEPEDFSNCVAPGATRLRHPDRDSVDLSGAVVLVADRLDDGTWPRASRAFGGLRTGATCHHDRGGILMDLLLPRFAIA